MAAVSLARELLASAEAAPRALVHPVAVASSSPGLQTPALQAAVATRLLGLQAREPRASGEAAHQTQAHPARARQVAAHRSKCVLCFTRAEPVHPKAAACRVKARRSVVRERPVQSLAFCVTRLQPVNFARAREQHTIVRPHDHTLHRVRHPSASTLESCVVEIAGTGAAKRAPPTRVASATSGGPSSSSSRWGQIVEELAARRTLARRVASLERDATKR